MGTPFLRFCRKDVAAGFSLGMKSNARGNSRFLTRKAYYPVAQKVNRMKILNFGEGPLRLEFLETSILSGAAAVIARNRRVGTGTARRINA
jgi:hypothetical protein